MKKSTEIINLPIISITEGVEIGQVKSIIINPDKFSVDFLTTQQEDWQIGVKAIPFKKVIGVGEYAVTVENDSAIMDLSEIPIANELFNKKISLIGSRVMTRKGELLGEISEYHVNDDNGDLVGLSLKVKGEEVILPITEVITLGKQMVIVSEHAKDSFVIVTDDLESIPVKEEAPSKSVVEPEPVVEQPIISPAVKEEAEQKVNYLKDKQIQLLINKNVMKDIYNQQGELLIKKGTILTEKDITSAQGAGPTVFVELSMNVSE
ncbi:PRC-barrel domain-containing protein [Bacillus sp. CGMCC 1.16541]|uniref:PRC-barrel domain-containing protein n=1 Tax=Bacillus sp. CGMCC 1.16541 TaxID=2185143 RepID=UPI000D72DB90|nr:PRC-barrel domain-containing protein [Bacillus sp. CGMCC 1.16541]